MTYIKMKIKYWSTNNIDKNKIINLGLSNHIMKSGNKIILLFLQH